MLASSAREPTNYQREEFLGDSVLKLLATLELLSRHLGYPESILSKMKDHIVSNSRLARAAIRTGLDQFIITKPFTGSKWRIPTETGDIDSKASQSREISTKILADVVEAMIGATFLEGGYSKAVKCLRIFLPEEPWNDFDEIFSILHNVYTQRPQSSRFVHDVEQLLGYEFGLKSLLIESVIHASYPNPGISGPYERLEFVGDAVLDNIVTVAAYNSEPSIPVARLHLLRSALVNADLLGYLCLRHNVEKTNVIIHSEDPRNIQTVEEEAPFYLWQALRQCSPTIMQAQQACLARLQEYGDAINSALTIGDHHPWSLLAQLEPPKPYSDIIESILGAIYIDSHGDLTKCSAFLERIGLMSYMKKLLTSDVALLHPKEELGQLSNQAEVQYTMSKMGEGHEQRLVCNVIVGGRTIATVNDGLRLLETQTRAAEVACKVLRDERLRETKGLHDASREHLEINSGSSSSGQSEIDDDGHDIVSEDDMSWEGEGQKFDGNGSDEYMTANEL